MRQILLAAASTIAISTSAAMAADLGPMPAKAPPLASASWTGAYLGLNAGYAWGNSDPTLFGPVNPAPLLLGNPLQGTPGLRPKGFIGGGQAGYNWQTGQFVIGGEVDFSGLATKADASVNPFFSGKGAKNTVTWSSSYDWLFTARLRGGITIAPNWLLYATGGLAVTQARDSVSCIVPATSACGDFSGGTNLFWAHSETLVGGTVGGGIETLFAPNWTARVEYLYAKFNDTTAEPVNPPVSTVPVPALFSFRHDLNLVRVGINYKFAP